MTTTVKINIVSDHVCPWCYIGKRRLEQALAQRPEVTAQISWLPFQLSPDMPPEGKDRREHYESIFGADRAREIIEGMRVTGAAEGLDFQTRPGARSPNTMAAHRLMYWAAQLDNADQTELAEKLFVAHHVDCDDIGNPDVLARLAGEVGMDPAAVRDKLQTDADEEEVRAMMERARQMGVTGVPFFIVNERYAFSGAQPPEAIVELLDRLIR